MIKNKLEYIKKTYNHKSYQPFVIWHTACWLISISLIIVMVMWFMKYKTTWCCCLGAQYQRLETIQTSKFFFILSSLFYPLTSQFKRSKNWRGIGRQSTHAHMWRHISLWLNIVIMTLVPFRLLDAKTVTVTVMRANGRGIGVTKWLPLRTYPQGFPSINVLIKIIELLNSRKCFLIFNFTWIHHCLSIMMTELCAY